MLINVNYSYRFWAYEKYIAKFVYIQQVVRYYYTYVNIFIHVK